MPMETEGPKERMYSAFISHASVDRKIAAQIVAHIEQKGLTCWIAPRDIAPGAEYADEIMRGIERSRCFVIVLSEAANQSSHVRRELERAASKGKAIYPIRVENTQPSAKLEYFISMHHWIDAFDGVLKDHAEKLAFAIDATVGPPAPVFRKRNYFGRVASALAGFAALAALAWTFWPSNRPVPVQPAVAVAPAPVSSAPQSYPSPFSAPQSSSIPAPAAPARGAATADSEFGADFFRPNVVFSNGGWGVHMPTRVSARFVNSKLNYSFDGSYYTEANLSARFFFSQKPDTNKLYIKYDADGGRYGPFEYDFDYGGMKTAYLLRDSLRNSPTAKLFDPIPGSIGGFSVVASISDQVLKLKAIIEENIPRYQIDFGNGFYESFNAQGDGYVLIKLFDQAAISKSYDNRMGIIVVDTQGRKHGPVQVDIDLPLLMKMAWQFRFDELQAIACERRNPTTKIWDTPAQPAKVVCYPSGNSGESATWSGIKQIAYGTTPQSLDTVVQISPTDTQLLTQARWNDGRVTNQWGLRNSCNGIVSDTANCMFRVELPPGTEALYARITYFDGRNSSVLRFAAK